MRKIISIFLLSLLLTVANAEIYKWTDELGRVHFSDKPVNKAAKEIQLQQQNISTTPAAKQQETATVPDDARRRADQSRLGNSLEADRINRERQTEKKKREKAQKEQNCRYAKRDLKAAKEVSSVFNYDEQGNKYYYNKQQRQAYIQKRQSRVDKWCNQNR